MKNQKLIKYILIIILVIIIAFVGMDWISKNAEVINNEETSQETNEEIEEINDDENEEVKTSADNAPPGSIHNLPVPDAVTAVKVKVASDLNINEGEVIVMSAYEKDWSDGCLGLGGPAESCIAVITPGYEVTVLAQGDERVFRTNSDGSVIREE